MACLNMDPCMDDDFSYMRCQMPGSLLSAREMERNNQRLMKNTLSVKNLNTRSVHNETVANVCTCNT